jgi:hypothetical protein
VQLTGKAEKLARTVVGVVVLGAAGLNASAAAPGQPSPDTSVSTRPVFFDGRPVQLVFARVRHPKAAFKFGPWELEAYVSRDKPRDPHPNLYIVAPGDQYTSEQTPAFDHTEIISTLPVKTEQREWDVYWAVVLDPALRETFHSERQLILATQNGFSVPTDFDLEQVPGIAFLRQFLKVQTLEDMERFQRPDGTLPRLIIVPAGLSIKATAVDPEAPPDEEGKSSLSRALSAIMHGGNQKSRQAQRSSDPPKR